VPIFFYEAKGYFHYEFANVGQTGSSWHYEHAHDGAFYDACAGPVSALCGAYGAGACGGASYGPCVRLSLIVGPEPGAFGGQSEFSVILHH